MIYEFDDRLHGLVQPEVFERLIIPLAIIYLVEPLGSFLHHRIPFTVKL